MGNELKLSLENFQSIAQGELVFHTGTNVIVGQSNSGKTATFRALKACLSNPAGSQRFIKKGTKSTSVILEYNGNQIIWKRSNTENSYIINGETYIKTGRSNAFKLLEDTGFVTDWNDTVMNIEEELQLPFPFGISKNDLFKLFENVFCISDSAIILKAAKGVENNIKLDITTLENEINKNKNKLEALGEFKKEIDLNKLKEFKLFLKSKGDKISFLKKDLPVIHRACRIQNLRVDEKQFNDVMALYKEHVSIKETVRKLKELNRVSKGIGTIEPYKRIPLDKYSELKELRRIKSTVSTLERTNTAPVIDFKDKIKTYKELKEYLKTLKSIHKCIKEKKEQLKQLIGEIKVKEDYLKTFEVCPLCHKPL